MSGVVRAHVAAKALGLQMLPRAEFYVQAGSLEVSFADSRLVVVLHNTDGWGNLCEFITTAFAAGDVVEKGSYRVACNRYHFAGLRHCEIMVFPLLRIMFKTLPQPVGSGHVNCRH